MVRPFVRLALAVSFAISLAVAFIQPGLAQDARQNSPGQFDFYVLSLSWSPSFCASSAERAPSRKAGLECERGYSFVVHGLWPQYDKGFPEFCQVPAPRIDRTMVSSMLDLMPAPRLIFSEWDRHGTCSGLSPRAYFDTVRKARAVIKIPSDYLDPQQPLNVSPAKVENAFIKANPDLAQDDIAIGCDKTRLTEVRICMSKDLKFHACPDVVKRSCQREQVLMPPTHGAVTDAGGAG